MSYVVKHRKRVDATDHWLFFESRDRPGSGFSFPCNDLGTVSPHPDGGEASERRAASIGALMMNPEYCWPVIQKTHRSWWEPGLLRCDCGAEVDLCDGWWNTCDTCGADYDGNGSRLAPRSQWGEETGEVF